MLFPLEKVVFSLLNFAISLIAVAAVIAFFQIPLTWNILLLPLLLFYIFLFCLGLGCCCRHSPCSSATSCIFGASC